MKSILSIAVIFSFTAASTIYFTANAAQNITASTELTAAKPSVGGNIMPLSGKLEISKTEKNSRDKEVPVEYTLTLADGTVITLPKVRGSIASSFKKLAGKHVKLLAIGTTNTVEGKKELVITKVNSVRKTVAPKTPAPQQ